MTQEEKQLLLKDLCARLPYGTFVQFEVDGQKTIKSLTVDFLSSTWYHTEWIKPYLRPMSSMTDEEREEFRKVGGVMSYSPQHDTWAISAFAPEAYDWLNKNKFDYRGLIPMGLALVAKEGMYNIK